MPAAAREPVDGVRHELLAAAARTVDQSVLPELSGEGHPIAQLPDDRALAYEAVLVGSSEGRNGARGEEAQGRQAAGALDREEEEMTGDR
jgi:hypothetical protein